MPPTMDGGVIHAAILQSTLRERACSIPEAKAAAALTAMFVPAATAGFADATRIAGKRRLPRTSPTAPPSNAAANDANPASASCQASRASPRLKTPGPG